MIELPDGYGQIIYEGYRKRAGALVGNVLGEWNSLQPDDRACWDGAAEDLAAYLARVPR